MNSSKDKENVEIEDKLGSDVKSKSEPTIEEQLKTSEEKLLRALAGLGESKKKI